MLTAWPTFAVARAVDRLGQSAASVHSGLLIVHGTTPKELVEDLHCCSPALNQMGPAHDCA